MHHREDKVKDYCKPGSRGWDGSRRQRLVDSEAEVGRVDWTWVGRGGRIGDEGDRLGEGSLLSLGFEEEGRGGARGVRCESEGEEVEDLEVE